MQAHMYNFSVAFYALQLMNSQTLSDLNRVHWVCNRQMAHDGSGLVYLLKLEQVHIVQ